MRRRYLSLVGSVVAWLALARGTDAAEPDPAWAAWTASPLPLADADLHPLERAAIARCDAGDSGLENVARAALVSRLRGTALPDIDGLAALQRAAGEPHPWLRAWAIRARSLDPADIAVRLDAWLGVPSAGSRRCGAAAGVGVDGIQTLVVVVADVLADLAPVPTRVRTGEWVSVAARMRIPVRGARVLLLGPAGRPQVVPSWMDGSMVRARVVASQPGEHDLQIVADTERGPRPVLDATFFADVLPSPRPDDDVAPGEDLNGTSEDDRLARMVGAARGSVGLPALARDARLDAVAAAHAAQMARAHVLAHDAGDGDPVDRLRAAGLDARDLGENVAHAPSLTLAHRALWDSPAHRLEMLTPSFDRLGVAVAHDDAGDVWVVETFAAGLGP